MGANSLFNFDWGNEKPDQVPSATPGDNAASIAAEAAIATSRTIRKRRGGQGKNAEDTGGTGAASAQSAAMSPELRAEMQRVMDAAYDPKAWASLLALPADVALAITGRKHWETSKDERETLGACGSVAARYLMVENPKTLALLMLSSALFSVYVPRVTKELQFKRGAKTNQPVEQKT